jgi:serine/threonine-protein kinase
MPDGSVYFVMEYLDGEPLTTFIRRGGSVPVRDAVHILRQIASALGAAHARGIVHRDLKPDNVYLVKRGGQPLFVKVLDFGIAKVGGASSKLTKTGMVFGTPHYMSPEQAAGQTVDQRTDIYALGVIMYEMFVGKVPFDADTFMGILSKHMFEPPVPPSQAGAGGARLGALEDITLRALQKKPEHRYQTMAELLDDLDCVTTGGSIVVGARDGIAPPDNLADALEPPSRTEMRLSSLPHPPASAAGVDPLTPVSAPRKASPVPLVVGAGAVVLLLGAGVTAAYVLFGGRGAPDASVSAGVEPGARPGAGQVPAQPPRSPAAALAPGAVGADARGAGGPTSPAPTAPRPVTEGAPLAADGPQAARSSDAVASSAGAPSRAVRLDSSPAGAEVYLSGSFLGNTPLDVPRPASGERTVELRLPGHRPQSVLLSELSPATLTVTLPRVAGGGPGRGGGSGADRPPAGQGGRGGGVPTDVVDPWQP